MQIYTLYKVGDTVVYYNTSLANDADILAAFDDETVTLLDCFGNEMKDRQNAKVEFLNMTQSHFQTTTYGGVCRNMIVSLFVISAVRTELIEEEPATYLSKMSPIIGMIQLGMFSTAAASLIALEPDDVLTNEQITRWSNLLLSADAVTLEE